jgi:hypothetical protein
MVEFLRSLLLGYFVADNTTNNRSGSGTQKATTHGATCYPTYDSTSGSALFLMGHAGTSAQTQGGSQQDGGAKTANASREVHENILQ